MKNISIKRFIVSSILASSLWGGAGCSGDFFDAQPDNMLGIESIFNNRVQTEGYWGGLFSAIPDIWDQPYNFNWGAITDELDVSNWANSGIESINNGAISSDNTGGAYATYYKKIRQCNVFIANVDKNQELRTMENGAERVKRFKAEATFLEAYYYWLMVKMYGPVPIMPRGVSPLDANYQIPRSTLDDCIKHIITLLDEAAQDLPIDFYQTGTSSVDISEIGRINKMIISSVKSQVLLFHASPLFNGNRDMANFKNLDGTQLFNQTYDANRWAVAATSAKAAIDLAEANGKGLFKVVNADPFQAAILSTRNVFWDGWQKEGIWIRSSSNASQWEIHASPRAIAGTAYNGIGVMQPLVDDFRMKDGLDISESITYSEVSYDTKETEFYAEGVNKMYTDREPRFYTSVTFNGSKIPGAPKAGMKWVEFFSTGNSGRNGAPRDWPKTGYTARKNINPTFSVNPSVNVNRPAMLIRLAELYLNYAEALNESNPGHPDVLKYLNAIRERGGIPALKSGLTKERMRDEIRRERRIELCFEGHRYFDVRRWKVPTQAGFEQGGNFEGMDMTKGTSVNSPDFYKRIIAVRRAVWNDRNYFYPFHQMEIDRNKQLVQLPGF